MYLSVFFLLDFPPAGVLVHPDGNEAIFFWKFTVFFFPLNLLFPPEGSFLAPLGTFSLPHYPFSIRQLFFFCVPFKFPSFFELDF